MMLTLKQPPAPYGYKSVHDLPTPPSTSRPSPPLSYHEVSYKSSAAVSRSHSPVNQLMSVPHRGLPPPAAMALPPQQQPPAGVPPPPHQGHHSQPPPVPLGHGAQLGQGWTALPPPPQQWQGAEESMRNWLLAKAEEEKTKQEEERTRQETLRLEQRRVEMDMLRASLGGGIPPPMVPLVFAGMGVGGTLPQAALEWAQQYMQPSQGQHAQLLPPQGPHSPDHHPREGPPPAQGQYPGPHTNPAPAQGPGGYTQYPGSPTRPRGQTVSGAVGRPVSNIPSLGTNPSQLGQATTAPMPPYQSQPHVQTQSAQQDASPSIYFHHWHPPSSQAGSGSSNRPGTPSGDTHRKRKTTGSQQPSQAPSEPRPRSPPPFIQSSLSNPPPGRRTHKRQKSDVSWYRSPGHGQVEESDRAARATTPNRDPNMGSSREAYGTESKKHSVSALLSQEPAGPATHESSRSHFRASTSRHHDDDGASRDRLMSPGERESRLRGGAAGPAEEER
ncbi:Uncharacterized protein TPAR_01813 [Tolypocladium paradoxum]|uniref:Uncharacterized protein n=1 Tax=Tolypocladium paradoxum TaxID=94208 RepID=A0A2S4L698_9HYPO|nr:Uncharacterized protein TPAR_01813 [Tolypocladium paradoxum]